MREEWGLQNRPSGNVQDTHLPFLTSPPSLSQFQQQPSGMPLSSYVWDVSNPNTPDYEMTPSSQICCSK